MWGWNASLQVGLKILTMLLVALKTCIIIKLSKYLPRVGLQNVKIWSHFSKIQCKTDD